MVTSVEDADINRSFPAAFGVGYCLKSDIDSIYNCIAWAAGVTNIWWWPDPYPFPGRFWPNGVPRQQTLQAFMQAYATVGYTDCRMDGSLERGYERIAIFATPDERPQHAARQLLDGVWTSKLGGYRDIHHTSPAGLETSPRGTTSYGRVVRYMKRERRADRQCLRMPGTTDSPLRCILPLP